MFRGGFLLRFFLALLLVVVLVGGGYGLYRLGWVQGYEAHALVSAAPGGGQGQSAPPAPYYGYGPWFYGPHFWGPGFGFFPFFPVFGLVWIVIAFLIIGGIFRRAAFRRWGGGPGPGYWHYHAYPEGGEHPGAPAGNPEEKPEQK